MRKSRTRKFKIIHIILNFPALGFPDSHDKRGVISLLFSFHFFIFCFLFCLFTFKSELFRSHSASLKRYDGKTKNCVYILCDFLLILHIKVVRSRPDAIYVSKNIPKYSFVCTRFFVRIFGEEEIIYRRIRRIRIGTYSALEMEK